MVTALERIQDNHKAVEFQPAIVTDKVTTDPVTAAKIVEICNLVTLTNKAV